ncbi:cytokine-dependent hematopoietic cell linker-like [Brachionichthys hirsutus]|uniref:cytokine-dependent hematopoietic cell linker-like n=1 Tax=Brachionichthys hirsutus TaxID=412623 RepID=UPI00360522F8
MVSYGVRIPDVPHECSQEKLLEFAAHCDCRRTDRKRNRRRGSYNSVVEPEYHVVEGMPEVAILPAKPIDDDRDYADKDLRRSAWTHSLSSASAGNSSMGPRNIPLTAEKIAAPLQPEDLVITERSNARCSPSPPPLTSELASHLPGLTLQEPCIKESQQSPECVPPCEWPQAAGNFDGESLVPTENPLQACCEEDWYVGACSRTDAEHALHLVNKDGAFLVRDCSIGTAREPLVLVVYHDRKVYNVKIRFTKHANKYTLGTRQRPDDMFDSVADIIKFHSIFPIILVSGRHIPGTRTPENCVLTCPVSRRDVEQLLQ